MQRFGRTTTRGLLTLLICVAVVEAIARAEEAQSGKAVQQDESGTERASLSNPASDKESSDIDATKFLTGGPHRGTTCHNAPDGPALIRHESVQHRAFEKPLKLQEDQEVLARFYINVFFFSHADFKLVGQVFDTGRQPMRDVQMTVTAKELTNIWNGTRRTDVFRQRLTDGRFEIDLKGYIEVDVSFEKDGFRREIYEPQLAAPDPKDVTIDRLAQRETPKIRTFAEERLRIVLAKPKPTENLYHDQPTLSWRSDDRGAVADFGQIFRTGLLERQVDKLSAADDLPSGCLMFSPVRDAGGAVVLDGEVDDPLPASVEFRVNDEIGGLQLVDPNDRAATLDQIVEAPEDGYAEKLTLTAKQLRERCCFFVRTRDRYAKCRIETASAKRDGALEIAIAVAIKYQRRATRYMNEIP